jgi:hypothetical protein
MFRNDGMLRPLRLVESHGGDPRDLRSDAFRAAAAVALAATVLALVVLRRGDAVPGATPGLRRMRTSDFGRILSA